MKCFFSRKKSRLILAVIVILMALITGGWMVENWPDPPVTELRQAAAVISKARNAEAAKYAPDLLRETTSLFDSAMLLMKKENDRFFFSRNFSDVKFLAGEALQKGKLAIEKATAKAEVIHLSTASTLENLEKRAARFREIFAPLPLKKREREAYNKAVMLLSEVRSAREKADYHIAEARLEKAAELLGEAEQTATIMLRDYFSAYPQWKELAERAVTQSAHNGNTLILVEKMTRTLRVYQNGKQKAQFKAEFGPNWIGHKNHKGDKATPEGAYYVVRKKERNNTVYYKALLINYPNSEDQARFKQNIRDRKFSRKQEIGGLIEIHGHGGRGFDWTDGCVALENKDMDFVYGFARENTPVVIVGSLEPFEKVIRNVKIEE